MTNINHLQIPVQCATQTPKILFPYSMNKEYILSTEKRRKKCPFERLHILESQRIPLEEYPSQLGIGCLKYVQVLYSLYYTIHRI